MSLVAAINLCHSFGSEVILTGATLSIESGERVGLVGRNGAGKSTLLRAIAGLLEPDEGHIQRQRDVRIGYLRQDPEFDPADTLRDAAERAFAELHSLHQRLQGVYDAMATATDAELDRLLRQQAKLETRIEAAGGYAVDHRIDATLHGLGFGSEQFAIKCGDLSGGQRARLALAMLLLETPDAILLDEPTNHLDINGRRWLEEFLADEFSGAVLMVTHDRYMLDRVVNRIAEIEGGRVIDYPGGYEAFRTLRRQRRETMSRAHGKQQTDFRRQEQFIKRYKTGQRAKEARGRQLKLDRQRAVSLEKPLELETFRLTLAKAPRSGDVVISARGVSKSYTNVDQTSGEPVGKKTLFHDLDISIGRGERWAIIGPNGAGKTTLARCLLGEISADTGEIKIGANVIVGHYRQMQEDIDPELPVYRRLQQIIRRERPDTVLSEQQAHDLAGAFLFSGDDQEKPMGTLSGGERSRVALAGLLASAKNLLVLDEPTNHLDIPSAERLEDALTADPKHGGYDGTLLLISHDRALIDASCDHLIVLDGEGGAEVFVGGYSDWRRRQAQKEADRLASIEQEKMEERARLRRQRAQERREQDQQASPKTPGADGLARLTIEALEQRIEQTEKSIRKIDEQLADPDVWSNPKRCQKLGDERSRFVQELEPLEFEWSRRAGEQ